MQMKRLDAAKNDILREWDIWAKDHPRRAKTPLDAFVFFEYLKTEKPSLLNFAYKYDKWQMVKSWLIEGRRIKPD